MKNLLNEIAYHSLWALIWLISLLPLRALYLASDFLAWFACRVLHYRRSVVVRNLAEAFPEKSREEIKQLEKKFYRWFTDYIVETVKCASMSRRQMKKRMKFENIEEVNKLLGEGRNVILYLGHYGNWEWVSSMAMHLDQKAAIGQIYHKLADPIFDRIMLRVRSRWDAMNIEMKETMLAYRQWGREKRPSVVGFIADQIPNYQSIHLWIPFLNHETAVFTGAERIARITKAATFYCSMTRPRRGYYTLEFHPMSPDASREPANSQTIEYFRLLEEEIRRVPELWLWSHRRWKRSKKHWELLQEKWQGK